jgi:proteasome lid subunit RPN8/RPN11
MPFGPYKDFEDCIRKNKDKNNPEAYCAALHKKITGKFPTENSELKEVEVIYHDG